MNRLKRSLKSQKKNKAHLRVKNPRRNKVKKRKIEFKSSHQKKNQKRKKNPGILTTAKKNSTIPESIKVRVTKSTPVRRLKYLGLSS